MPRARPYSRADALAKMDRRSVEARILREVRTDLTAQVGGKPSAAQRALIDRVAWLTLHIAQIDAKTAEGRAMTEYDARQYLAWCNTLAKTLTKIGLKGVSPGPPRSFAEAQAQHRANAA